MTDQYAVFGNPIKHSKSPRIHATFAERCHQDLQYSAVCVEPDQFEHEVEQFLQGDGKGLNITVPFKQQAWTLCQRRSTAAERAGAVNTLYRNAAGELCGDNTDGIGLVRDLANNGVDLAGLRVLMVGAGGAVRGVIEPFMLAGVAEIVITNRTASKAEELACLFADLGRLQGCGFAQLEAQPFDLIVNGTSASLQGELPPLSRALVAPHTVCYDMMYGAEPTPFCQWATQAGARLVLDGLGMLVEQAAEAFRIWRGVLPDTAAIVEQLRAEM